MDEQVVLEVFYDYVWPFCWLAEPALREFERIQPEVRVARRAFELRPEPVPTLDPQGAYLTRVWQNVVYPMAERMRIAIRLPPVQPRSQKAHEATYFAAGNGKREAYQEMVFRSFFHKGEDIGQEDLLVRLAEEIGLNGATLRQALQLKEFEPEVKADQELAERLGVQAVPAYVVERKKMITGVRTVDELLEFVFEKEPVEPPK